MCGHIRTIEEWRTAAENETLPTGGPRYELTDLYGPNNQHGLLIEDKMSPADWRVLLADGEGTVPSHNKQAALDFIAQHDMIVPTEMQLTYIKHGTDVFEQYGGKFMHEWIEIGDLNRRKHVHPEPPASKDDMEQFRLFATAYSMTMTEEEAINTLSTITALESLVSGTRNPFAGIGASPDLGDLLGLPQSIGVGARSMSLEEFEKAMEDDSVF